MNTIFVITADTPQQSKEIGQWFWQRVSIVYEDITTIKSIPDLPIAIMVTDGSGIPALRKIAPKAAIVHVHYGMEACRKLRHTDRSHSILCKKKQSINDVEVLLQVSALWQTEKQVGSTRVRSAIKLPI